MQLYETLEDKTENQRIIEAFDQHIAQHNDLVAKAMQMLQQRPTTQTENRSEKGTEAPEKAQK
jgi:hypothetical protein